MITKINAELDTIETAELAARMIKQKTGGIINIRIENSDKHVSKNSDYNPSIIPFYTQNGYYNFVTPFFNSSIISNNSNSTSIERSRTTFIEIICEKDAENVVTQIFNSLGGLKINKK